MGDEPSGVEPVKKGILLGGWNQYSREFSGVEPRSTGILHGLNEFSVEHKHTCSTGVGDGVRKIAYHNTVDSDEVRTLRIVLYKTDNSCCLFRPFVSTFR